MNTSRKNMATLSFTTLMDAQRSSQWERGKPRVARLGYFSQNIEFFLVVFLGLFSPEDFAWGIMLNIYNLLRCKLLLYRAFHNKCVKFKP